MVQFAFAQRKGYWQQKVDYKIDVDMKEKAYFGLIDSRTQNFIGDIRDKLNEIHT